MAGAETITSLQNMPETQLATAAASQAARTRVLRYSPPRASHVYGALQIDPNQLIGIQGDAIYTTHPEQWTLPEEHGGIDDGADGRIRLKGYLAGPLPAPLTIDERQKLSNQAEERGTDDVY